MDVTTDPSNPWIAYAAVGGFSENTPSTPGHVYVSTCTTHCTIQQWSDVSGNLPDIPANAIVVNPNIPNQVFVGTDWGLYYTDNINALPPVWQRFEGLPHVMIWSLSIDRGFTTLAAFTRSRGAWAWPLPQPASGTADLAVTVAAPATAEPGLQFNYTITVTNNGPSDATNVQVDSTVPAGFTSKGNSGDCTTAFPCVFPTLAAGASVVVTTGDCVPRDFTTDPVQLTATVTSDTTRSEHQQQRRDSDRAADHTDGLRRRLRLSLIASRAPVPQRCRRAWPGGKARLPPGALNLA